MDPGEAERRFAERLEEAAMPPFVSAEHDTARARVEWRASLEMLDEVIAEFCG